MYRSLTYSRSDSPQLCQLLTLPSKISVGGLRGRESRNEATAWLTEIHEYAQQDVVIMLLGNKVRAANRGKDRWREEEGKEGGREVSWRKECEDRVKYVSEMEGRKEEEGKEGGIMDEGKKGGIMDEEKEGVTIEERKEVDSSHDRMVKREEGEKLAKEFGVPFMETSARSGLNVELAFTAVGKELKHRTMKEPEEPKFQLQQYVDKEMRTVGCCRT
ncbi:hypothetical protein NQZ68_011064 [Dissostichus eleginoides]|nr:hypothetical protein NQZ68_011064 [Dissostichus eleginoides]